MHYTSYRLYQILCLGLLSFGLSGCDVVNSEDINTSGIYMSAQVYNADNGRLDVSVSLSTSSNLTADSIKLGQGDSLYAVLGGQTELMTRSNYTYKTTLDHEVGMLKIRLERSDYVSASDSEVDISEAVVLTNTDDDSSISESEPTLSFTYAGPSSSSLDEKQIGVLYQDDSDESYTKLDDLDLVLMTDNIVNVVDVVNEYNTGKAFKLDLFNVEDSEIQVSVGLRSRGEIDGSLKGGNIYYENEAELVYNVEVTE